MWILTKQSGEIFYLLPEKEKYVVGRTSADLILTGDLSISRIHAFIFIETGTIKVVDVGSKYGTYCNDQIELQIPMKKDVPVDLKAGDRIKFGGLKNEWAVSNQNVLTLVSTLNAEQKNVLKRNLDPIGGKIVETWNSNCTHLTMEEITVTTKVLRALVENIPIVSLEFWKEYLKQLRGNGTLPKVEDFSPKLAETYLNKTDITFQLNRDRKTLFTGKIFIFMSRKLYEKYNSIITSAGGSCKNLNTAIKKPSLIQKNVIVVQNSISSQSQSSQTENAVQDYVRQNGRRLIPEFEIGLALVYCSTAKYCNPECDIVGEWVTDTNPILPSAKILAKETPIIPNQNCENYTNDKISVEIPESFNYPLQKIQGSLEYNFDSGLNTNTMDIEKGNDYRKDSVIPKNMDFEREIQIEKKRKRLASDTEENNKRQYIEHENINKPTVLQKPSKSNSIFNNETNEIATNQNKYPKPATGLKRIKKFLMDSDSDDELFNFGPSDPKKLKQIPESELTFNHSNKSSLPLTPKTTPPQPIFKKLSNPVKTISVEPVKIPTDGWLSKSFRNLNCKIENEIKSETDPEASHWYDSTREFFQVRVKTMHLVSRSFKDSAIRVEEVDNNSSISKVKNFKPFKKQKYKPQTEIAQTISLRIGN